MRKFVSIFLCFIFLFLFSNFLFSEDLKFEKLRRDYIQKMREIDLQMTKELTLIKLQMQKISKILEGTDKDISVQILKITAIIEKILKEGK